MTERKISVVQLQYVITKTIYDGHKSDLLSFQTIFGIFLGIIVFNPSIAGISVLPQPISFLFTLYVAYVLISAVRNGIGMRSAKREMERIKNANPGAEFPTSFPTDHEH